MAVSRNNISLDTGSGADQYYDQVCALSAKTINDNFVALFKQRPEVKALTFNDGEHGVMTATVKPPRIMIDPNQERDKEPKIYLQIAFEKGNVWYSAKHSVDISGWVITVTASLGQMCASAEVGDDDDTEFLKRKVRNEIKKTFTLEGSDKKFVLDDPTKVEAGEYSIHRLFAAFTENSWSSPVYEYSTAVDKDGKVVPLADWESSGSRAVDEGAKVKETLKYWAIKHEYSAYFTLGLQLRPPKPEDGPQKPTFTPFAVRLQGYPYISQKVYDRYASKGQQPTGEIDDPYNCLVFCETVGRRELPKTQLLAFSGNLGAPVDDPAGTYAGTFVLDHRLFLFKHLLPRLQELCMGVMIVPLYPRLGKDGSCEAVYTVGGAPTDPAIRSSLGEAPPILPDDPYYSFTKVAPRRYEWRKRYEAPGSGTETYAYRDSPAWPRYRHWKTWSEQAVTVSWEAGASALNIQGTTVFFHWEAYSSQENFPWVRCGPEEAFWGEYVINTSWSVSVDLTVATKQDDITGKVKKLNGVVDPTIKGVDQNTGIPSNFYVSVNQQYDIGRSFDRARQQIQDGLASRMKFLIDDIKNKFTTAGRFVYPGTGTLDFGKPRLADNGDVYANIDYLPPKDGLVTLRAPDSMPFGNPLYKVPEIVTIPTNPTVNLANFPHLAWQITPKQYDPKAGRFGIQFKAGNPGDVAVAFQMVKIQVLPVKHGNAVVRLFEEGDDEWEERKEVVKKDASKDAPTDAPKDTPKRAEPKRDGVKKEPPKRGDVITGTKDDVKPVKKVPIAAAVSAPAIQGKDASPAATEKSTTAPATPPAPAPAPAADDKSNDKTPAPPPAAPTSALWSFTKKDIDQDMRLTITKDGSLDFRLLPSGKSKRRPRFILDPKSTFTVELEGTAPEPGTYVVQMHELWETTDLKDEMDESMWADAFATVKLVQTGDGSGDALARSIGFQEAETLQGVQKTGGAGTGST